MFDGFSGARWWKFDFHAHTPASVDTPWSRIGNEQERLTPAQWLLRFMAAGVDCVAVTDHNTSDWIDPLKEAYKRLDEEKPAGFRPLFIFPGVELSVNGGFHLLAILGPDAGGNDVRDLITSVQYEGTPGHCDGVTRMSAEEVVGVSANRGALAIPAHVDEGKGLLRKGGDSSALALDANTVRQVLQRREILAAEVVSPDWEAHQVYREAGCEWTEVLGSDCHNFRGEVKPGDRFTWVKMGEPSLEGLRLALLDGSPLSVKRSDAGAVDPNEHPPLALESVEISNARFVGRGEPLRVGFTPWLSAVVGGRGTGKSTIIEMLRLGLDRAGELPERLRDEFARFARSPESRDDQGALLDDTAITVVYRKSNGRFRVRWRNGDASIEEQDDAGDWSPSPGDVQNRFPIRVFSQKQVFVLADDPDALLRLVDAAAPVELADQKRRERELETRYLSLCGQARELEARLADRGRVEGELADVRRQLAVFEEGGHQALLLEVQRFRRQQWGIQARREEMDDAVKRLRNVAAEIEPSDIRDDEFGSGGAGAGEILGLAQELSAKQREVAQRVSAIADEAEVFLKQWLERSSKSAWAEAVRANHEAYHALAERLQAEGVADPTSYGDFVQRRHALEREVQEFDTLHVRVGQLRAQAVAVLGEIEAARIQRSRTRMDVLARILSGNDFVSMAVVPFGKDAASAETAFRDSFARRDAHLRQDILGDGGDGGILAELYRSLPTGVAERIAAMQERVAAIKRDVATIAAGGQIGARTKWFHNHVHALRPEQIDRFMCWWPEDGLQVRYRRTGGDDFVPIEQGSPGQKSAAILAFLLSHGDEPIVLDQPEDDLDNHLIHDLIVQQIRVSKRRRQVILATHNPNIVVNGDAEMVIAMDHRGGQCVVVDGSGCLQDRGVRDEICRVMEGGRQAFEHRYRRLLEDPRHA